MTDLTELGIKALRDGIASGDFTAREAAEALRLTAQDLLKLGVVDRVIPEPLGGAHRDSAGTIAAVGATLSAMLGDLEGMKRKALIKDRQDKFLTIGEKGLAA